MKFAELLPAGLAEARMLETSSIGCTAMATLKSAAGTSGAVHSVFDAAVNLDFNGGLVSLVRGPPRGPLNLVLRSQKRPEGFLALGLRIGEAVSVSTNSLRFENGLEVTFESARVYWPRTKASAALLGRREIGKNIDAAGEVVLNHGNMAGVGGLVKLLRPTIAPTSDSRPNMFMNASRAHFAELLRLLSSEGDSQKVRAPVRQLIGLGPGLTPSADDALSGLVIMLLLYSRSTGRHSAAVQSISRALVTEATGRTTRLSEEYLKQASLGRGNESIMNLCNAILAEGPVPVIRATRKVLSMGASSGTDMLFGVIMGAMLCAEMNPNLPEVEM